MLLDFLELFKVWASNFSIPLCEGPKNHRFHDFGLGGRVHGPRNQHDFIFGDTKTLQKFQEHYQTTLGNVISGKTEELKIDKFKYVGKDAPGFPEDPSQNNIIIQKT